MADDRGQEQSQSEGTAPPAGSGSFSRMLNFMQGNKIEAALWCTRIFTIISTLCFLLPIFGGNPFTIYQRALLSNAATSALRLHQRLPNFQLNRQFFGLLMLEDSAHYLFYSLIFVMGHPVTMSLSPVFLFAVLHATNYTVKLLDQLGPNSMLPIRNLIAKLKDNQVSVLRFIACNEIIMMPVIVFMIFSGHSSLLMPFVYYRFLSLRYASRRNPYCRQLFYEFRVTAHHLCNHQSCPRFISNIVFKAIDFITRLAPPVPAQ